MLDCDDPIVAVRKPLAAIIVHVTNEKADVTLK